MLYVNLYGPQLLYSAHNFGHVFFDAYCTYMYEHTCSPCTTVVEHMEDMAISDSLCVGQPYMGDERVILFLKMAPGHRLVSLRHL